jgi:hypothetical protein
MAKQRKKKKVQQTSFKVDKYIVEAARKLPIYKVYLDPDIHEEKIGAIVVARKRPNDDILFCSFIVDLACLGVKDVYYDIFPPDEFEEFITELSEDVQSTFEEIDINKAANIIYAGVEYADQLGIAPTPEFDRVCIYMLPDIEDVEYMDVEVGIDGRPVLRCEGGSQANFYIAKLEESVGEGSFDVELFEDDLDLFDDEWDDEDDDDEDWDDEEGEDDDEEYTEFEEVK